MKEKKFINLTPHTINIVIGDNAVEIAPSGVVARCMEQSEKIGEVDGIPLIRKSFGEVEGLPKPTEGTIYIVSALVAQAAKGRDDVFFPGDPVRDEQGRVIGCKSLCRH